MASRRGKKTTSAMALVRMAPLIIYIYIKGGMNFIFADNTLSETDFAF